MFHAKTESSEDAHFAQFIK